MSLLYEISKYCWSHLVAFRISYQFVEIGGGGGDV